MTSVPINSGLPVDFVAGAMSHAHGLFKTQYKYPCQWGARSVAFLRT